MLLPHLKSPSFVARRLLIPALASSLSIASASAAIPQVAASQCDRDCLRTISDKLLDAVVSKREADVPLALLYSATENGVAASPSSMTIWRLVTATKSRFYVLDQVSGQVYIISTVKESGTDTVLFGRVKVENRQITELELYTNRTRGQDGVSLKQGGDAATLPIEWTQPVSRDRLFTREQLIQVGRSKFDRSIAAPPKSDDCVLMEQGKIIAEHPKVWAAIRPQNAAAAPPRPGKAYAVNPDGSVPIPCGGGGPMRPEDPAARVDIVDEVQGIVVARGTISGRVVPYLVTEPTESVEVPDTLVDDFPALESLRSQMGSPRPSIRPMPVSSLTSTVYRIYDGKIQGMMLLFYLAPPGAKNPFMTAPAQK